MPEKIVIRGVEYTLPSSNGFTFESKAAAYQLLVRDRRPIYDHGIQIGWEQELTLEFGDMNSRPIHDEHQDYEGKPGTADYYSIRGHFANTLQQARDKGWSDDERAMVEKKALAFQHNDTHWLKTKTPAQRPWPTYDEIPAAKVAEMAQAIGVVNEAIEYERENKNRKTVLEALVNVPEPVAEIEAVEA